MENYKLINPFIEGSLKCHFNGDDNLDAAQNTWNTLSKYITNNVPKFAFTLENTKDGTLSHFLVKETMNGNDSVKYKILELDDYNNLGNINDFKSRFSKFIDSRKLSGGKKHRKHKHNREDDGSSSSSSSSS